MSKTVTNPTLTVGVTLPCGCVLRHIVMGHGEHHVSDLPEAWKFASEAAQLWLADRMHNRAHRCDLVSDNNPCGWEPTPPAAPVEVDSL